MAGIKLEPFKLSMLNFTLAYVGNIYIFMMMDDLCLLPACPEVDLGRRKDSYTCEPIGRRVKLAREGATGR
jgi:hypothetical protein